MAVFKARAYPFQIREVKGPSKWSFTSPAHVRASRAQKKIRARHYKILIDLSLQTDLRRDEGRDLRTKKAYEQSSARRLRIVIQPSWVSWAFTRRRRVNANRGLCTRYKERSRERKLGSHTCTRKIARVKKNKISGTCTHEIGFERKRLGPWVHVWVRKEILRTRMSKGKRTKETTRSFCFFFLLEWICKGLNK